MKKRLLSMMLTIVMVVSMLPLNIFAAEIMGGGTTPPAPAAKIAKIENFVTRNGDVISLNLPDGDYVIEGGAGDWDDMFIEQYTARVNGAATKDVVDLKAGALTSEDVADYELEMRVVRVKESSIMSAAQLNAMFKDVNLADVVDVDNDETGFGFIVCKIDRSNVYGGTLDGYPQDFKAYAATGIGFAFEPYGATPTPPPAPTPAPDPIRVEFYNNDGTVRVQKGNYNYEGGLHNGFQNSFGLDSYKLQNRAMGADNAENPTTYAYLADGYEAGVIGWATEPNQTVPTLTADNMGTAYHSTTVKRVVEDLGLAEVLNVNGEKVVRFYAVYQPAPVTVRYMTPAGEQIMKVTKTFTNPNKDGNTVGFWSNNLINRANNLAPIGEMLQGWTFTQGGNAAPIDKNSHAIKELIDLYGDYGAELKTDANTGKLYVEVYAVWEPIDYTVVFDANGGDGNMVPQNFVYKEVQSLTPNAFTKTGHKFLGWATESDGNVVYTDGAQVSNLTAIHGDVITLYAVWERVEYSITVVANESGEVEVQDKALYGADVSYTITPYRGYRLVSAKMICGVDETDLMSSGSFTMPAGNVIIVVEFEKIIFDIIINNSIGGTVVAMVNGTEVNEATIGDDVVFVVTPDEGWKLKSMNYKIMVDGSQIGGGNAASSQYIQMPAGDVYVTPVFEKIIYNITVTPSDHGTIITKVNGVEAYEATIGDVITFEAIPSKDYALNDYKLNYYFDLGAGGRVLATDSLIMRASDLRISGQWVPLAKPIVPTSAMYRTKYYQENLYGNTS